MIKKLPAKLAVLKSFCYAHPAVLESLPLMREVDSPSGEDGGRETSGKDLSPSLLLRKIQPPSSEGAFGYSLFNRRAARWLTPRRPALLPSSAGLITTWAKLGMM